ncbi:PASTA domain-containing protein [Dactylosporangium salmoneum]|uniref:PASTA domain-containing protein n=1 Tax=Dactylosporangium salmoneum TaxID=53361 RepID=A0ABN3I6P8_9ACTN
MPTNWVVTTAAERIVINDAKQGETTFTVTNPSGKVDRVVFEAVPGEGADPSWFTVDEPQRRVAPAQSVTFLVKAHVPQTAPPGTYEVQGRVYSADSAPEESSVLSNRVVFEIAAPPAPQKKKIPWWIIAVAAGLVVITAVTVTLVLTLGGGGKTSQDLVVQPSPSASGPVTVPDVTKLNETQAVFVLKQAGLTAGTIRHKFDATHADQVLEQTVAANSTAEKGSPVGLVVAVKVNPPTLKTAPNAPIKVLQGKVEWDQAESYVTHWAVNVSPIVCVNSPVLPPTNGCGPASIMQARVDQKSYELPLHVFGFPIGYVSLTFNGQFQWAVAAVDDFGNIGPFSPVLTAQMVA